MNRKCPQNKMLGKSFEYSHRQAYCWIILMITLTTTQLIIVTINNRNVISNWNKEMVNKTKSLETLLIRIVMVMVKVNFSIRCADRREPFCSRARSTNHPTNSICVWWRYWTRERERERCWLRSVAVASSARFTWLFFSLPFFNKCICVCC